MQSVNGPPRGIRALVSAPGNCGLSATHPRKVTFCYQVSSLGNRAYSHLAFNNRRMLTAFCSWLESLAGYLARFTIAESVVNYFGCWNTQSLIPMP